MDINNSKDVPRELKTLAWAIDNNGRGEITIEDVPGLAKHLFKTGMKEGIYTLEDTNNGNRAFFVLRKEDSRCLGLAYDPPYLSKCFRLPYRGVLAL